MIQKGQSLFEVVVSLAVVAVIAVGLVSLATRSLSNADSSKDNSAATRLNQEAVEYVRGLRDTDFDSFYLQGSGSGTKWCLVSISSGLSMPTGVNCPLVTGTGFQRVITITHLDLVNNDEVQVDVVVSWSDSRGDHDVTTSTVFTDWRAQ